MDTASGQRVAISWDEAREANRRNWDSRAPLHEQAYQAHRFVEDRTLRSAVVLTDLPVIEQHLGSSLAGKDVAHLQCHIGTDTLSLARSGARVTGLDLSPASLEVARRLAGEAGEQIRFVESDVMDAAAALGDQFDVVYTSVGVLCWLQDLDRWATQVAALLRPGGIFHLRDGHPMMYALDEQAAEPVLRHAYFGTGQAQAWDDEGTYIGDGTVAEPRSYEWPHPMSEVVGALLRAGLQIERLDEGRTLDWRFSERMVESPEGYRWPAELADIIPCTFTVVARRG
ncbi:class I SAM-dependent methyltransferase [Luteococcus peritonei]|uniref:Class I SAM-dependent methyltransferase n=1 Tax=Luteococcus peritonei TaxID=88874 RepID=A0ABW4RS39_9ACTN